MKTKTGSLLQLVVAAMTVIALAMAAVPALAQNPVPPTARQAAASPTFASKLHASKASATSKRRLSPRSCADRTLPRDGIFYENGPVNGTVDAWTINFGYVVSDSFTGGSVTRFDIGVWEFPGDVMTSVQWSI